MISANSTWSFKRHRGSNPQSLAFGRLGFPSQRFEHLPHLRNPGADATNVTLRFLLLDLEQLHWLLVALQIILDVTNRPFRSRAGDDRLLGQILRNLGFGVVDQHLIYENEQCDVFAHRPSDVYLNAAMSLLQSRRHPFHEFLVAK